MSETEHRQAGARIGWIRLGIGLAQGVAAWLLIRGADLSFAADNPILFAALVLAVAFPPLILLAGLGHMRGRPLLVWILGAAVIVAALAAYDLWREPLNPYGNEGRVWPGVPLILVAAAGLYIAHHLIEPADVERRWFPSYRGRFDIAWRHGFQLALALGFTGVFWGVLVLGAELFRLIGVGEIRELMRQPWFVSIATAVAFAGAVHLTDVRPGLIQGVRTVGLTLLSWLLPLMTALIALFLFTLLFTGVTPLWNTRRAAALLLTAAAALIVLINAAYQDGEDRESLPAVLRWAVRAAALVLTPLTLLAAWATALRIGQYGLTPERIASVAVLLIAALYAAGYGWAALSRGAWMRRLEPVNVVAAVAMLAATLLLFSPVADPARLSVADQVRRLQAGRTPASAFDFAFLRFDAGRFGREALQRLAASPNPAIAAPAAKTLTQQDRYADPIQAQPALARATVRPAGAALPEGFRSQVFARGEVGDAQCLRGGQACDLLVMDLDGDAAPEVLALTGSALDVFGRAADGRWVRLGDYRGAGCPGMAERLRAGGARPVPPQLRDLEVEGRRLRLRAAPEDCDPTAAARAPRNRGAERPGGLGPAFEFR